MQSRQKKLEVNKVGKFMLEIRIKKIRQWQWVGRARQGCLRNRDSLDHRPGRGLISAFRIT